MLDFDKTFIEALPSRYDDGPEMGVFPAIAAAIPMVANLAGSLLSKKGKDGAPAPEASSAQNVLDVLTKAIGGDQSEGSIKEVVRNIVATVPSPVMNTVKQAIKDLKNADKASKAKGIAARDLVVNKVDAKFGPQIHAILAATKAAQLQRQATFEHNKLQAKKKFRSDVLSNLIAVNNRLSRIEKRLKMAAIVHGANRIDIMGGRGVLER